MRPTRMRPTRVVAALALLWSAPARALPPSKVPGRVPATAQVITPNDNRRPAGVLANGTLTVHLEARRGVWYPEGPTGKGVEVAAWGELGKPLQNPGPLLRVPRGTVVTAVLHNALAEPLTVYGLGAARGLGDSVRVAPGGVRTATFTAGEAGTFWYAGKIGPKPFDARIGDDSQLNGALVVDPSAPSGQAGRESERVFLLSWYFALDSTSRTGLGPGTMTINGLAWPHTERLDLVQGDSTRWRLVNLTQADHPMHLHGFYFRVDAKGDGARDTVYSAADRRLAVTEVLLPNATATLAWAPQRAGNWVFHCHYHSHISHLSSLETDHHAPAPDMGASHDAHTPMAHGGPTHSMFGLVLGMHVAPRPSTMVAARRGRAERPVRILVRERPNVYGTSPGYAFVLGGSADDASGALPIPARPLVLTRDEPVAVTIVNRAHEAATIHWHGIELESYPDGVPGFSGEGAHLLPSIPPGDSMTVHFTPPRAGTFMFHSHFDEMQQINSGLYGPIIVLAPGETYDPETDRVFFVGQAGPTTNVIRGPFAPLLLNGAERPETMEMKAGVSYRMRFLNLSDDFPTIVTLGEPQRPATWRAIAKDGADLPASQAVERPAVLVFDPGEVYDFRFTPRQAGDLTLTFGHLNIPGLPQFAPVPVPVRVR